MSVGVKCDPGSDGDGIQSQAFILFPRRILFKRYLSKAFESSATSTQFEL